METLYTPHLETHYTELVYHCIRGSDATKAIHYARLMAEQAVGRAAHSEATSLLQTGLKLLEKLPQESGRLRAELELRSVELVVNFALHGPASPEVERTSGLICDLGEKIGEADQLLRGLLPLAVVYFTRGEPVRGLELGRRCLELAEATQDRLVDAR
jgi:hypothetical protein